MVASVTNANSLTHSTNVLGHGGELFSSINSSVELLDYWRQSVSFIVPVKSIIWEWRTFQVLIAAVCLVIYTFQSSVCLLSLALLQLFTSKLCLQDSF